MSLRLFQITDIASKSKSAVSNTYYSSKKTAKLERQRLNDLSGQQLRYVVSPGPDHHKYKK